MSLTLHPHTLGTSSPRSHPYAASLSSSASSSTSSVFSDVASQISSTGSSVSHNSSESEEWSSRARLAAPSVTVDPAAFAPITRVSTFPPCQPPVCRESSSERFLPPLRTDIFRPDLAVPAEQRQHPRRSSTFNQRPPPQLVRQTERKVNFVDCLVG